MKGLLWFSNIFLKMFPLLLCILLFSNCATTPTPSYFDDKDYKFDEIPKLNIIDQLPDGIKKGYVEFHGKDPSLSISPPISLYKYINGQEELIAKFRHYCRYRMAMPPGEYNFEVRRGSGSERINLMIKEEMISLVGIEVKTYGALDRPLTGPCANPNITCFIMKVNATNNFIPEKVSPESVEYLIDALKDPYWGNRAYAAEALGKLEDRRATDPLITVIVNIKEDKNVRIQSIEALEKIGDPKAIEPLIAVINDKGYDFLFKRYAVRALGKFNDNRSINALLDDVTINHDDVFFARDAMVSLVEIGGIGTDYVIKFAEDKNYKHRSGAIWALGTSNDSRVLEPLNALNRDNDKIIRQTAKMALKKVKKNL